MASKKNLTRAGYTAKTAKAAGQKFQREADYGTAIAVGTIPLMFLPGGAAVRGAAVGAVRGATAAARTARVAKTVKAVSKTPTKTTVSWGTPVRNAQTNASKVAQFNAPQITNAGRVARFKVSGSGTVTQTTNRQKLAQLPRGTTGKALVPAPRTSSTAIATRPSGVAPKTGSTKTPSRRTPYVVGGATLGAGAVALGVAAANRPRSTRPTSVVSPQRRGEGTMPRVANASEGTKRTSPTKTKPPQSSTPSGPSSSGGGGGGGNSRTGKGMSRRTRMVKERLRLAEDAARSGNVAAAANYAAAARDIQRKGKGSAKSMKRVTRVAGAYSKAAGRTSIANEYKGK